MLPKDTDKHWESYGQTAPYFGVLSDEKFQPENLDEGVIRDFFASGEDHIERVVEVIKRHLSPEFNPRRCLDFGCGVGRLVFPLARRFEAVVGVDISRSMILEAQRNSERYGTGNVSFHISDDNLSKVSGTFDFIHSYIVMQHIPAKRGEKILRRMIDLLDEGGVGALHLTYSWDGWLRSASRLQKIGRWLRESVPLMHNLVNLAKGRRFDHPLMLMNRYDLNNIYSLLQQTGCGHVYTEFTDHDGHFGAMIYFRKEF